MAAKQNREKSELLRSLETSRRNLSADFLNVGDTLNVPRRFQESVREHSLKWIGGGLFAGVLLAVFSPRRRKSVKEKAKRGLVGSVFFGLLGVITKQALRSAMPSLQTMAQEHLQQWTANRESPVQEDFDEFKNY